MIKRSFSEFHTQRAIASQDIVSKMKDMESAIKFLEKDCNSDESKYIFPVDEISDYTTSLMSYFEQMQENLKYIMENQVHYYYYYYYYYHISPLLSPSPLLLLLLLLTYLLIYNPNAY